MEDCCSNLKGIKIENNGHCPSCKNKAKNVKLITLKSLLKPSALETLNAKENHYFCSNEDCDVVYFDTNNKKYFVSDIKVAVNQKMTQQLHQFAIVLIGQKKKSNNM